MHQFNKIGLNPYQQIRYEAVEKNSAAFRMWKSRMKKLNLPIRDGDYVMRGYEQIKKVRENVKKDDKS